MLPPANDTLKKTLSLNFLFENWNCSWASNPDQVRPNAALFLAWPVALDACMSVFAAVALSPPPNPIVIFFR